MMAKNLVQKILESHEAAGTRLSGHEIGIRIDHTLVHDNSGPTAYMLFEALGYERIKNALSICCIDHKTTQVGFENADDHRYLRGMSEKIGAVFSPAGNGICHQVYLERFAKPGITLLAADSHACTAGAIGALGVGVGGLDVAVAMGGGPYLLPVPKIININLVGELRPWVGAKDVILKILQMFSAHGNENAIFEFGGPGTATLTVPQRATIANMGAECGVISAIFPSDAQTLAFCQAQQRASDWQELLPDPKALYDDAVEIDLSRLEPLVAVPHRVDKVRKVRDLAGLPVDQVAIGTCTNAFHADLALVARMLKNRKLHPEVSLAIAPGSRQVLKTLAREGSLYDLVDFGARILEASCGFCIGACFSPPSEGVSVRTSNRNFLGRSGTKNAQVYLASPATAAASAITGRLTDPRQLDMEYPQEMIADQYPIDDSIFVRPDSDADAVVVVRGPNIKAPPLNEKLPPEMEAEVAIRVGDGITTNHILPGGRRNKYRANIPQYAHYVFESLDSNFHARAREIEARGLYSVIVGGEGYGEGSAREHAALCPMHLGVKAVIAKSFARMHRNNLVNFGIVPLIFEKTDDYSRIQKGDKLKFSGLRSSLSENGPIDVVNTSQNVSFRVKVSISPHQTAILLAGGAINLLKSGSRGLF